MMRHRDEFRTAMIPCCGEGRPVGIHPVADGDGLVVAGVRGMLGGDGIPHPLPKEIAPAKGEQHPIEATGRDLRALMSWVKSGDEDYIEGSANR